MTARLPRILYIDDDEALRQLARRALTRRGYEVSLAASGSEGVRLAAEGAFDLIAVDHYMPAMDGLATLAALRAAVSPPPIVYVTGSEESSVAVAALKAGAADYVVKSIDGDFFDLLDNAFRQALEQVRLRREKNAAEEALQASHARLQVLLREVNHRVANSLQLISSFVSMQSRMLTDEAARTALKDTERRIQAVGQVHRKLYTSDNVESVEADEYLAALVGELEESWSTPAAPRAVRLAAEPIQLNTDKAVSLGIIVNELVTNACKYAYASSAPGEVRVALRRDGDGHFVLEVEDDGCGMPVNGTSRGTGLGSKVIRAMAASLKGELHYDSQHRGVRARLRAAI